MVDTPVSPVAVIGMGCRLPGGIDSPAGLWEALLRGDDTITTVPLDRWDAEEYFDPEPGVPGRSVSKWGAFLDDVAGFDAEFFGISEREAAAIDPQHRLLLETAWEALEHAGVDPATLAKSLTGVFMGMTGCDYELLAADAGVIDGPVRLHRQQLQHGVRPHLLRTSAYTAPRTRSTRPARRACSPCTWRAAACAPARATSRWPAASRSCSNRARCPPGRRRACCRRPVAATPST